LKSHPALSVCFDFSMAAFFSVSTGAWMQCTLSVESSWRISLCPTARMRSTVPSVVSSSRPHL